MEVVPGLMLKGNTKTIKDLTFGELAKWYQEREGMLAKAREYLVHWTKEIAYLEHDIAAGKKELKARVEKM